MATPDDERPARKITHELGQDLSRLSVDELAERVVMLKLEIERLEAARVQKDASRRAADAFFKL
jgi:uncharacterized small protein (DUF1192 family)